MCLIKLNVKAIVHLAPGEFKAMLLTSARAFHSECHPITTAGHSANRLLAVVEGHHSYKIVYIGPICETGKDAKLLKTNGRGERI
jgi:hypothetical protein